MPPLLFLLFASALLAGPVAIRPAGQEAKAITLDRDDVLYAMDKRPRKFAIVPGLADKKAVSLEMLGSRGSFIRHQNNFLKVHTRPQRPDLLFEQDATWRIIEAGNGKVRLQSFNYPAAFIMVRDDGLVLLMDNPPVEKSTFVLKDQ